MRRATCAVALSALCLAAMPALAAPLVTSDSDCPSAGEVAARLEGLWSGASPASVAAHVRVKAGQMTVELVSESEPAASRSLPTEPDCESRAQAAALVIAAWLDTVTADPLGLAVPVAIPPALPTPQVPAPVVERSLAPLPRLLLDLGAFASGDARGAGAVLSGEAAWLRLAGRFGLLAGLWFPLPRELSVGQGTARWWRPVLALALRVPLTQGSWILDGGIGPALGLLVVTGNGFDQNHTDVVASWGATAGLRLAHRSRSKWAYWAELRGLLWPAAQNIRNDVSGSAPRLAALPRIEGQLGLGFSFAIF